VKFAYFILFYITSCLYACTQMCSAELQINSKLYRLSIYHGHQYANPRPRTVHRTTQNSLKLAQ